VVLAGEDRAEGLVADEPRERAQARGRRGSGDGRIGVVLARGGCGGRPRLGFRAAHPSATVPAGNGPA